MNKAAKETVESQSVILDLPEVLAVTDLIGSGMTIVSIDLDPVAQTITVTLSKKS